MSRWHGEGAPFASGSGLRPSAGRDRGASPGRRGGRRAPGGAAGGAETPCWCRTGEMTAGSQTFQRAPLSGNRSVNASRVVGISIGCPPMGTTRRGPATGLDDTSGSPSVAGRRAGSTAHLATVVKTTPIESPVRGPARACGAAPSHGRSENPNRGGKFTLFDGDARREDDRAFCAGCRHPTLEGAPSRAHRDSGRSRPIS